MPQIVVQICFHKMLLECRLTWVTPFNAMLTVSVIQMNLEEVRGTCSPPGQKRVHAVITHCNILTGPGEVVEVEGHGEGFPPNHVTLLISYHGNPYT